MSTNTARAHGAKPPSIKEGEGKILTAVRTVNKLDAKGRAVHGQRKVFVPGQEKEMKSFLSSDQVDSLEESGHVMGLGKVSSPTLRSLKKDPTVMAGSQSKNVVGASDEDADDEDEGSDADQARARVEAGVDSVDDDTESSRKSKKSRKKSRS